MRTNRSLDVLVGAAILLLPGSTGEIFAQERAVERSHRAANAQHLAACSPDCQFYVVVTAEGRITHRRTSDGATLRTFYQCNPKAIAFSPDGRHLASIGASNGSTARINVWNVDDSKLLCRIETQGGNNPLLSFSPDGLVLASTSGGSQIDFWQLPEGTLRCSTTAFETICSIAFSKEGHDVVAIAANGKAQRISVP